MSNDYRSAILNLLPEESRNKAVVSMDTALLFDGVRYFSNRFSDLDRQHKKQVLEVFISLSKNLRERDDGYRIHGEIVQRLAKNKQTQMNADLYGVDFRGLDLDGLELNYLDLISADLSDMSIKSTSMVCTVLVGCDLSGANLVNIDFGGANLKLANMENATLEDTTLVGADLRGANLRSCIMKNVSYNRFTLMPKDFDRFPRKGEMVPERYSENPLYTYSDNEEGADQ